MHKIRKFNENNNEEDYYVKVNSDEFGEACNKNIEKLTYNEKNLIIQFLKNEHELCELTP